MKMQMEEQKLMRSSRCEAGVNCVKNEKNTYFLQDDSI